MLNFVALMLQILIKLIISFHICVQRLLTENQKIELHSKALKYLRQHTKRCMACGEIQFTRLLGKTAPEVRRTKLTIDDVEMHQLSEEATYTLKTEVEGIIYIWNHF